MADSHPNRPWRNTLFEFWDEEVDSDYQYVQAAMEQLGLQSDYADLPLNDQQLVLAVALAKKRAWRMHLIGRA